MKNTMKNTMKKTMKNNFEVLNFSSDLRDFYRFKKAVEITCKNMMISNNSIEFDAVNSCVKIFETRSAVLINIGVNYNKLES